MAALLPRLCGVTEEDEASISLVAGSVVVLLRRLRRQPTPLTQAEDEMSILYFLLPIVGLGLGLPMIQLEGVTFAVGLVLYAGVLAYLVGASLPLQLVLWKQLSPQAARRVGWRVLCPLGIAGVGALIGCVLVAAT